MGIAEIAVAALAAFPPDKVEIMVAIAGAESSYVDGAKGDYLSSFPPPLQERYRVYAFAGALSFGPWQVFLGVHTPLVQALSQKTDPNDYVPWLLEPENNARVAAVILANQGLEAWSTYNNAAYLEWEIEASHAVAVARANADAGDTKPIAAVSFNGSLVHLDHPDGSFTPRQIGFASIHGDWIRFDLTPRRP